MRLMNAARRRLLPTLAALSIVLVGAVGCADATSTAGAGESSSDDLSATSIVNSPTATATASAPATATGSPTSPGTPTSTVSPTDVPATPSAPVAAACATSALKLSVDDLGGGGQQVFAAITLTNVSTSTCSLVGFPDVSPYAAGSQIGTKSEGSGAVDAPVLLAPNAAATSKLTDATSCNAPLSDTIKVTPPNQQTSLAAPFVLRACALQVTPLVAA
ncbi:uncharacterized protein DUF4232 [Jatrophihabitans sp. GAS493]|uniref:DUF4232 domain-containing protein n=1 Tax=Jatrophihabitans sp. GAS493 TaxID=1907575 RepID=UPI000BB8E1F4|nr:DUF4232 domain-containing protein [Jatrophihabitans sp. GAS493]SOD70598.1 uncharacterized protein DUF4232 [Jatrophihabitans sp. GAS493]